jgi:hypothetical protein
MNRRQFLCDAALGGAVIPEVLDVLHRELISQHLRGHCFIGISLSVG